MDVLPPMESLQPEVASSDFPRLFHGVSGHWIHIEGNEVVCVRCRRAVTATTMVEASVSLEAFRWFLDVMGRTCPEETIH